MSHNKSDDDTRRLRAPAWLAAARRASEAYQRGVQRATRGDNETTVSQPTAADVMEQLRRQVDDLDP